MAQNNSILLVLLTALSASLAVQPSVAQEVSTDRCPQSDLLLENAVVYTADDEQWSAEAVAIRGDRIVFVGSAKEANQWRCGAARVIDLEGAAVFPGFTDSHQHLEGVGRRTRTLSLSGLRPSLALSALSSDGPSKLKRAIGCWGAAGSSVNGLG